MAEIYEIPITTDEPAFKLRTVLEDIELVLNLRWNSRQQRWILDIYSSDETALLLGLVLNINMELIRRFQIDGLPAGSLMLFRKTGQHIECDRDELGNQCALLYETSE